MHNEEKPEFKFLAVPIQETGFEEILEKSNLPVELLHEVKNQLKDTTREDSNIIFVFTEGDYVITGIHVPSEVLDGEEEPLVFRGSSSNSIIAAFSHQYLRKAIDGCTFGNSIYDQDRESPPGLLSGEELEWMGELEKMTELVRVKLEQSPLPEWEDILGGGEEL